MLAVISTVDVPVTGTVQTVVTKLGVVLLILGAAHGLLLLMLSRIRARSRQQAVREMSFQLDVARRQVMTNPSTAPAPVIGIGPTPQR